ncbi:phage holin family protein [Pantoea sp. Nvir]|uniref:phage holin family protein n=1 Tax=Pantoea sp. Nvir TaxID=2576760 RepID=UPI0019506142|nr:phage holin family protein [Pantoea sp. Nvir]CAJ0990840.1 Inner membrane protein YqjE [Pantoea sp. Nvir]
MAHSRQRYGPGKGVFNIGQRIITILVSMLETRIRLAVIELQAEKFNLIQLLLISGLTVLFTAFSMMSLIVLIIWAIDPQYRLMAICIITGIFFLLAIIFGLWSLRKSHRSTLLRHTLQELEIDRQLLEASHDDK